MGGSAKEENNGGNAYVRRRDYMVRTQLEARGLKDARVLEAMRKVPRHLFVPEGLQDSAYEDGPLPIGHGQTISQPYMVGAMSELLELNGSEKVLEIGTGSGYQTAVLSCLAERVYSVERITPLLVEARRRLENMAIHNVALKVFDGTMGWSEYAPYDAILVTAGGPDMPKPLFDQLRTGGRMVIPVGGEREQMLHKIVKTARGPRTVKQFPCTFVKLLGKYGWKEE